MLYELAVVHAHEDEVAAFVMHQLVDLGVIVALVSTT